MHYTAILTAPFWRHFIYSFLHLTREVVHSQIRCTDFTEGLATEKIRKIFLIFLFPIKTHANNI